ncbi:MAG: cation:proton antiporter [bacterium]|jgi:Kef-type K+ transport system membrane component KefB
MNVLLSLGLILLLALLAGHLAKAFRLPEVTGYILAGVAVGPSGLRWINHENISALSVFSEVALGLILFSIGSAFEFQRVRSLGRALARITGIESLLAGGLVFAAMLAFGQSWQVAFLLGAIAMETAAASTLMVLRECGASGPLTDTVIGVIGLNNILCLTAFSVAAASVDLAAHVRAEGFVLSALYESGFPLVWQLVGSAALGYLMGLLIASWAPKVIEHGETLILLIGCLLLCVGIAVFLELSTLVASLAVGATMANLSPESRRLYQALSRSDPPFYAVFFVIAGADLNLGLLTTVGPLGAVYVICRAAGKFLGARIGTRGAGVPAQVQRLLGFALLSQAGLAVGLTLAVSRRFPDLAPQVVTIVLAAVIIHEIIGPLGARFAVLRSGEARQKNAQEMIASPA